MALAVVAAAAPAAALRLAVQQHELANGMRVLLHEDHSAPVISSYVFYRVGSSYENYGHTGLAHLFEHMMFNGSKKFGPGAFDDVIEGSGGSTNGYTTRDYTAYLNDFPSDALPVVLDLESDRMAHLLITPQNQWREDASGIRFVRDHLRSLVPAGRLDLDSVGLLVLTQDGRIARQLVGEDGEVEKEYVVRVARAASAPLRPDALDLLRHGLALDGVALRPAEVEWIDADRLRFVLREGRKRQIRRMCEAVGLQVQGLERVRIGAVRLGDLPRGRWRYLRADEAFAPVREAPPAAASEPEAAARAEQSDQADDDQVDRDDEVEQPGHDQDQDAGDQRHQGTDAQGQVHREEPT